MVRRNLADGHCKLERRWPRGNFWPGEHPTGSLKLCEADRRFRFGGNWLALNTRVSSYGSADDPARAAEENAKLISSASVTGPGRTARVITKKTRPVCPHLQHPCRNSAAVVMSASRSGTSTTGKL
jgi:hypothetical protein